MQVFGDVFTTEDSNITFDEIKKLLKMPVVQPRYKISVLNPDESVKYEIPSEDIPEGGISYSEEYQNGQRRNITLELINNNGKYTPSINNDIWLNTKFKFDIGIVDKGNIIWFPRGIYIMGDITLTHNDSDRTISIQLKDKYGVFEGKMGTLQDPYEIELDSSIQDVINGILNFDAGNGYILDYKPALLDPSFINFKTQSTIRVEEGGNLGQVIEQLALQLSAEYYYNDVGNLCFYPINETIDDANKNIIWTFAELDRDVQSMSLNYKNEEVINTVKVVGENIDSGIYSAIVFNDNPASPICVQQVGRRTAPTYNESSIWSNELAYDLANYYLRQASFLAIDFSCSVAFNPVLFVNNIVEVENKFIGLKREKLLITSISYSSTDGLMSLKLCNTSELPQYKKGGN